MTENHLIDVVLTIPSSKLDEFLEAFKPAYDGVILEKENTLFELSVKEDKEAGEVEIHLVEAWTCTTQWLMEVRESSMYSDRLVDIPPAGTSEEGVLQGFFCDCSADVQERAYVAICG